MFVDRIKVFAQAGNGGRGCVSFRREKFVPRGGPDGGDGGKGGDIVLRADVHTDNLTNLFYEPIIKAKSGGHGQGKKMHGRGAVPKIVKVPVGTVVYSTNESREATGQVADLTEDGEEFVLCEGGKGGKGNVHFKSSRNRAPIQFSEGEEGEQGDFLLELRTIADAGLVGYPNAGKSTLLGKLSAAHPKVAAYPFTTLRPSVGVVEFDEYSRGTIADIPGLIEGAHRNIGLGHDFLRHITRCRYLLFIVDAAGSEGRHPIEDLQSLRREIDLYDAQLSKRPWLIIANKIDLDGSAENVEAIRQRFAPVKVTPISAQHGEGINELKQHLASWLSADLIPEDAGRKGEPVSAALPYNG
ncbi:MAG: GTPase ObgE [Verrucomicrobiota bacterium]|nr:GTPase ObgE [Verrucomicrobiota bacterium]